MRTNRGKRWVRNPKKWQEKMVKETYQMEDGWEYGRLDSCKLPTKVQSRRQFLDLQKKVNKLSDKVDSLMEFICKNKAKI